MIIGVLREIKNKENRVGMVIAGVRTLTQSGHKVLVQLNAGAGVGISNEDYRRAGATIIESSKEIYEKADMIVKVKEPLPEEYPLLREGQILYTYLHLAADERLAKALMERKIVGIAYETIQTHDGALPLLAPMSAVAGRMATQIGATYLQHDHGGKGILLGGVTGVERARVVVLGGGVVGVNAAKMAAGLGAKVTIMDVNVARLDYLADIFGSDVSTLYSNSEQIERTVTRADLVIGAVLVPGAKAPKLVTREMVSKMQPGSVIVDVSVDQGGTVETCRPTSHEHPTYTVDGVIHYAVPNMPGAVPRTSTYALTNVTLKYALMIANLGWKEAVSRDEALSRGVNILNGKVAYKQVADDLGLPFEAVRV
ncbi:MAG: alanine dehydrogenase [Bdellovibrionales bacterium RIFOXYD1_FULL_55_31]|nr:MAG: alanine dehydrogenase [Bdellovibrionales bacterium RIFOXYD1_FULL_55_31]